MNAEIRRMAEEAGLSPGRDNAWDEIQIAALEKFAALVRDDCARTVETVSGAWSGTRENLAKSVRAKYLDSAG